MENDNTKNEKAPSQSKLSEGLDTLSGSEAVYGLLAWLTCRDKAVTFSAKHNANIAAELAKQFCEENNLADPRDDYHTRLIHPEGEIAIEGRGKNAGLCALIDELEEKREFHKAASEAGNIYIIGQHTGRADAYKVCIDRMMLLKKKST